jgi:hypothetical protein
VYHINKGDIEGVDPSVIQSCPVCTQIFQEMNLTLPKAVSPKSTLPPGLGPHVWLMLWLLEQQVHILLHPYTPLYPLLTPLNPSLRLYTYRSRRLRRAPSSTRTSRSLLLLLPKASRQSRPGDRRQETGDRRRCEKAPSKYMGKGV